MSKISSNSTADIKSCNTDNSLIKDVLDSFSESWIGNPAIMKRIKVEETKPQKVFREWVYQLLSKSDDGNVQNKYDKLVMSIDQMHINNYKFYKELFKYDVGDFVMNRDGNIYYVTCFDPDKKMFMGVRQKKDGQWGTRREHFDMPRCELSKKLTADEVEKLQNLSELDKIKAEYL